MNLIIMIDKVFHLKVYNRALPYQNKTAVFNQSVSHEKHQMCCSKFITWVSIIQNCNFWQILLFCMYYTIFGELN